MITENCLRFFHTARYLKPVQVTGRIWHRIHRPKLDLRPAPPVRAEPSWTEPIVKPDSIDKAWIFTFLNHTHPCTFPKDWNGNGLEKLWLYNLHYFDDLCSHRAPEKKDLHEAYIKTWMSDNPAGGGNGWEPYPISLRIVNWVKWMLAGNSVDGMHQSLAVQVRYLNKRLEYHLLGNHLFANGKALVFAGLFFSGEEAENWLNKGLEIITEELTEQGLDDGGHFERSPMYHCIILEDLLDLINILKTYGQKVPEDWVSTAESMLEWLWGMTHPDGKIVLFNDAAFEIAAVPQEISNYARRLNLPFTPQSQDTAGLRNFHDTGYISYRTEDMATFLDVAPLGPDYLPGHGHADTLSFELSLFGKRLIVDSGTSCYGISNERLRQRGTAAHNTVEINGENSSEVWSGFRVARRARPVGIEVIEEGNSIKVRCCHDGYQRLSGRPLHRREWLFSNRDLIITDRIEGKFNRAVGRVHLHPDVSVTIDDGQKSGTFLVDDCETTHWSVEGWTVSLVETTYHPKFGMSIPNRCLELLFEGAECSFQLKW